MISGFGILGLVGFLGLKARSFGLLWVEGQGLSIVGLYFPVGKAGF